MMQPWFDANHYAWIPGSAYGVAAGLMGGLVAWLALWLVAIALLIAGFVALAEGQPWGVWYSLLLPGAVGTLVVGANSVVVEKTYRQVEERRLAAKDLM
jgi:Na+/proline symporter